MSRVSNQSTLLDILRLDTIPLIQKIIEMVITNFGQVWEIAQGDDSFIASFAEQSKQELASYLICIREGVETRNVTWLPFLEHKSKTLFDLLGEERIANSVAAISQQASNGEWEVGDRLDFVERGIARVIENIKTELKTQEV